MDWRAERRDDELQFETARHTTRAARACRYYYLSYVMLCGGDAWLAESCDFNKLLWSRQIESDNEDARARAPFLLYGFKSVLQPRGAYQRGHVSCATSKSYST